MLDCVDFMRQNTGYNMPTFYDSTPYEDRDIDMKRSAILHRLHSESGVLAAPSQPANPEAVIAGFSRGVSGLLAYNVDCRAI
jgi:hypothetical protein